MKGILVIGITPYSLEPLRLEPSENQANTSKAPVHAEELMELMGCDFL